MAEPQLHWSKSGKGCYVEWFSTAAPYAQRDQTRLEKRLKSLHRRHIEADLYRDGDQNERIGGVDNAPGVLWNGCTVQWQWWYESGVFETQVASV